MIRICTLHVTVLEVTGATNMDRHYSLHVPSFSRHVPALCPASLGGGRLPTPATRFEPPPVVLPVCGCSPLQQYNSQMHYRYQKYRLSNIAIVKNTVAKQCSCQTMQLSKITIVKNIGCQKIQLPNKSVAKQVSCQTSQLPNNATPTYHLVLVAVPCRRARWPTAVAMFCNPPSWCESCPTTLWNVL